MIILTRMLAALRLMTTCICASLVAGACTTVVIHSEGAVRTEHHVGILRLSVDESHASSMVLSSFGISSVPGTLAVGWLRWKGVFIPQDEVQSCLFIDFGSYEPAGE